MARNKAKILRAVEIGTVASVAVVLFVVCRKLGVEQRGNALFGGEIVVPVMVPVMYGVIKSIIRDIKGGLFK